MSGVDEIVFRTPKATVNHQRDRMLARADRNSNVAELIGVATVGDARSGRERGLREYVFARHDSLVSSLLVDKTSKRLAAHEAKKIIGKESVVPLPKFFRQCSDMRGD